MFKIKGKDLNNKRWLLLVIAFVMFLGIYTVAIVRSNGVLSSGFDINDLHTSFYILWALLAFFCYYCHKSGYRIMWKVLIFLFGVVLIIGDPSYSPVDESSHLDYINYLIENKQLPSMYEDVDLQMLTDTNGATDLLPIKRYEAVQVPLYYVLMALLTGYISNLYVRFLVIRFAGLFCLIGVVHLIEKAFLLLDEEEIFKRKEEVSLLLSVFSLSPGMLVRFSRINNESLAVLLSTAIMYLAIYLMLKGFDFRKYLICTVLSLLLFYTKSTGAFCVGALLLVLLYLRKYLHAICTFVVYFISALPWFLFCSQRYGSFTGMSEHVNIILPITNPTGECINVVYGLISIFTESFFMPAEMPKVSEMPKADMVLQYAKICMDVLLVFLIMVYLCVAIKLFVSFIRKKLYFDYSINEKKEALILWAVLLVFCEFGLLGLSTFLTYLDTLEGRYLYFLIIPILILVVDFVEKANFSNYIMVFLAVICSLFFIHTLVYYTDTIGKKCGLWSTNQMSLNIMGYVYEDGEIVGVTIKEKMENTEILQGRIVITSEGENIRISEAISDHEGNVYLQFDYPMQKETLDNRLTLNGDKNITVIDYSVSGTELLENMENAQLMQSFYWSGGEMNQVMLHTATYTTVQFGNIVVNILDEEKEVVNTASIRMENCPDNSWVEMWLCDSVQLHPGLYYLEIQTKAQEGSKIAYYAGEGSSYKEGELYIDETAVQKDVDFKIGAGK